MTELEIKANLERNRKEILELLGQVTRPGIEKLIKWLDNSDFFTAPASTRFHSNYEGGLAEHSLNVYRIFKERCKHYEFNLSNESIIITALLHDVCKANFYEVSSRNTKKDGKWIQVPFYKVNDQMPLGHGEKSVFIINSFIKLTMEEVYAIRGHMGGYDDNPNVPGGCWEKCKWAVCLHTSDLEASYMFEKHIEY